MINTHGPLPADTTKEIVIIGSDDAQILDITGPCEILSAAGSLASEQNAYAITLAAPKVGPLTTSSGLSLSADRSYLDFTDGEIDKIDTLIVSGGGGIRHHMEDPSLLAFVAKASAKARRVASVCTGAFVLAAAGLLDGRRAVTHWMYCDTLAKNFPEVQVDQDAIYVRDGDLWTSAGVTAGMDLALALVEDDLGRDVALEVARQKVMFMMRPGGQSQYSSHLAAQHNHSSPLSSLLSWIVDHIDQKLSISQLAAQAAMSERNFARHFSRETGTTPARFVEAARVEAARRSLEETNTLAIDIIALKSGFTNAERMRRAFHRHLGISPQHYRDRFGHPPRISGEQT